MDSFNINTLLFMQNMKSINADNMYMLLLNIFEKIFNVFLMTSASKIDVYIKNVLNFIIKMSDITILYTFISKFFTFNRTNIISTLNDLDISKNDSPRSDNSMIKITSKPDIYYLNMYYGGEYKDEKTKQVYTLYNDNESNYRYIKYLFMYITTIASIDQTSLIKSSYLPKLEHNKSYEIADNLYCKIMNISYSDSNDINMCHIVLYSKTLSHKEIYAFLQDLEYNSKNSNKFNNNIYIFEPFIGSNNTRIPIVDPMTGKKNQMQIDAYYQQLPKIIPLYYSKYNTNKTFDNIIGDNNMIIREKIKFFTQNKSWYDNKGVPYHMTMLLSGLPGTGKTSTIKAVANHTKRHIINVSFNNIKTSEQLINLLTSDKLMISSTKKNDDITEIYIPINKRLYVLEEIDTFGDIVKQRTSKIKSDSESDLISEYQITLGHLLTLLDGTVEYPGRMIIITCNHPELLDKALIRGGRMDLHIHYVYCTLSDVIKYIEFIKDIDKLEDTYIKQLTDNLLDIRLSFADLYKFCNSENKLDNIITNIINYNNSKIDS